MAGLQTSELNASLMEELDGFALSRDHFRIIPFHMRSGAIGVGMPHLGSGFDNTVRIEAGDEEGMQWQLVSCCWPIHTNPLKPGSSAELC